MTISPAVTPVLIVVAIMFGYLALTAVLAVLVHPLRERFIRLGEELLADERLTASQQDRLDRLMDTAMSFRIGLLVIAAMVGVMIDEIMGRRNAQESGLADDPRYHRLLRLYAVSVIAANPLAALVYLPMVPVALLVSAAVGQRARTTVEEPLLRAAVAPELRLA